MIRAVIFDIDGTLIDSVDLHALAWEETLRRNGYDVPFEKVRAQIGKGGDKLLPIFLPKSDLKKDGKRIEEERTELFRAEYLPLIKPFPRVKELFERLRGDGIRIALASSAKKEELNRYKEIAGIEPYLEADTSADDVASSKPEPDVFRAAMKRLGRIHTSEVLAVGDTPYDAEAAGKAGISTVGMLCGGFPSKGLLGAGCIALYRSPADLLGHYEDSPLRRRGVVKSRGANPFMEEALKSANNPWSFLIGVGIGVGAALLYTPRTGAETRPISKEKASESGEAATVSKEDRTSIPTPSSRSASAHSGPE